MEISERKIKITLIVLTVVLLVAVAGVAFLILREKIQETAVPVDVPKKETFTIEQVEKALNETTVVEKPVKSNVEVKKSMEGTQPIKNVTTQENLRDALGGSQPLGQ